MVIAKTGINVAHFLGLTVFNTGIQDSHSAIFKIGQGKKKCLVFLFFFFILFNQFLEEMGSILI